MIDNTAQAKEVREAVNAFIDKLIIESRKIIGEDKIGMLEAIRNIEDNRTFAIWFTHNLEEFWN